MHFHFVHCANAEIEQARYPKTKPASKLGNRSGGGKKRERSEGEGTKVKEEGAHSSDMLGMRQPARETG